MKRIDILIDEIIKRSQETADARFKNYPARIEVQLKETYLTDEECIRNLIKSEAECNKGLRQDWYNVRNIDQVRLSMFMDIDSGTWPVAGGAKIRNPKPVKMYNRTYHAVLSPLFLSAKKIDYLKELLKRDDNQGSETGYLTKYSQDQLNKITDRLIQKRLITKQDRSEFISLCNGKYIRQIKWDAAISKNGLFDLMERIHGHEYSASELKKFFYAEGAKIHDKWKGGRTKIIHELMEGI